MNMRIFISTVSGGFEWVAGAAGKYRWLGTSHSARPCLPGVWRMPDRKGALMERGHWGSRIGFVLAAAGSAVGLGNVWKFPYMAAENGGAAFVFVYVALVFTVGVSVMLAEFTIGRAGESNPVGAMRRLKGGPWPVVGYMAIAAAFIILSFYSVVAGWTIAYTFRAASGMLATSDPEVLGAMFGEFSGHPVQPVLYHLLFMALTVGVVAGGVHGGIERTCMILLPILIIILVVLAIRSLTLPGAMEGLRFYLQPDFSKISAQTFNGALAQAFFSLSLGMGAMITYGSYLSHRENLPRAAAWVTFSDLLVALVAGLVILPAVFAFSFDPDAGPGLVFITLPAVFAQMPAGVVFAVLFFVLLVIAALTSAVSLLEVLVAYFADQWGWHRKPAAVLFGFMAFALGIPSSLSFGLWSDFEIAGRSIFDFLDYVSSNLLLPLGGLAITLFVGWAILPQAMREATSEGAHPFLLAGVWRMVCRYVAPVAIAWILLSGL
jgi:NSS family neurotransmitter:Na+ symporter